MHNLDRAAHAALVANSLRRQRRERELRAWASASRIPRRRRLLMDRWTAAGLAAVAVCLLALWW